MSLEDLFRFVWNTLADEEELHGEEARHCWNSIIKKGWEVEDRRFGKVSVAQNSSTGQLLMYHLVKDAVWLIYSIWRAKLTLWIG